MLSYLIPGDWENWCDLLIRTANCTSDYELSFDWCVALGGLVFWLFFWLPDCNRSLKQLAGTPLGPSTISRAITIGNATLLELLLATRELKSKVILHPELNHEDETSSWKMESWWFFTCLFLGLSRRCTGLEDMEIRWRIINYTQLSIEHTFI